MGETGDVKAYSFPIHYLAMMFERANSVPVMNHWLLYFEWNVSSVHGIVSCKILPAYFMSSTMNSCISYYVTHTLYIMLLCFVPFNDIL